MLLLDLGGRTIVERRMEPLGVVEDVDVVLEGIDDLLLRGPHARPDELAFEAAEEALGDGVDEPALASSQS